nr:hypothetical protein [Tanacetum cinerariifolium]
MGESAKRHEENSRIIKEIRASTDAAIRNQRASIKTLEIQIGQMSKVLHERGIEGLPDSTEPNPRDHVKSISTSKANSSAMRRIRSGPYAVSDTQLIAYLLKQFYFLVDCMVTTMMIGRRHAKTIKHPSGIAENVLVRLGKFIFPIDFVILDIPENDDVPLILGRPFLSTAHAKIDVFKRKITLRVREEKLVFKSIKPATSIIKRIYMVKERTDLDFKIKFVGDVVNESFEPLYDADHARCLHTRKSTSRGIQFLGDKLVSWMSKKRDCTAMSSAEAKYMALSASYPQVMWMRLQVKDYGFNYNKIPLYCDSQSAISISCNSTEYQLADIFTKTLPEDRFKYLGRRIGMRCLTSAEVEVLANESA